MNGEDSEPAVVGEVDLDTTTSEAIDDGAGDDQPLQRDAERGQEQKRDKGRFAKRETVRGMVREDFRDVAKKALADETDAGALDEVKPKGQDQGAKTDQRQPSKKGTLDTGKDGPADTTQALELQKAREHLKLDRWTDAKLAKLTNEQILDFGKEAQEEHARKYREGREQAAAAKAGNGAQASKQTPVAAEGDDEEVAAFEGLAKEHFAEFDDADGKFGKSLAGFAKATHARMSASLKAEIEQTRLHLATSIESMLGDLKDAVQFEIGQRDLHGKFPKAATPEGREALLERIEALRGTDKAKPKMSVQQALTEASRGLWGEEIERAAAERDKKLRDARSGGHADVRNMTEAPRKLSDMDIARQVVREHMLSS